MVLMLWTTRSTGAAFSIEEEILQLKVNYFSFYSFPIYYSLVRLIYTILFAVKSGPTGGKRCENGGKSDRTGIAN
jgi:hypothetical protein